MSVLIKGGTVVTTDWLGAADVLIEGETIRAVGAGLELPGVEVVDATGRFVLPGGIDVHTHLAMPLGNISSSDDFYTGHVAAAFGGTTTHLDFANQSKGESLVSALDEWHARAREKACIDYGFHVTVTDVNEAVLDEIAELPARGVTTIKCLLAYKGRIMVSDEELFLAMQRARDAGLLTMVHCENGDVIDVLVREALAQGQTAPKYHALTRPPQLEGEATGRAIAMAEVLDAPLYVVHVTCEEALVRVREARTRGSRVTAETCVQYLFFTVDHLDTDGFEGAKWVCSPPFRRRRDQELLWESLADGTLSVVSTDHCPFYYETQKVLGRDDFSRIPNGCPGIEDRLLVLHEAGVTGGRFDLRRFVDLTATTPARVFGLEGRKGAIAPGCDADIAIWNMDLERTVSVESSHSAVDYNLYEGMRVRGLPERVYLRGKLLVEGDRFLGEPGSGRYLHRRVAKS
ncbi:MAG TPA: dihydropyrimidinase [Chloroflexota bacterium]